MIHFDLARSKTGDLVMHQINSGKMINDNVHRDVLVDWKKEIMEELAKLVP